ncbi:hypothetical protein ACWGCC_03890 [Streptomyces nigrescens]
MSDDLPDDVLGLVEERIEQRLGLPVGALQSEIATAARPDEGLVEIVREYTELAAAEVAVEELSDELLDLLMATPGEFNDQHMQAAQALNNAVTHRDARLSTLLHAVEQQVPTPARQAPAAVHARSRQATAARPVTTSGAATVPAALAVPTASARRR